MSNIYILSQPIRTGKTTLLMNWINTRQNIGGILTPDADGRRKLYDISSQTYYDLQLDDDAPGLNIGRFVFDPEVFITARDILSQSLNGQYEWVVADEIGRLEMDRKEGLEPVISQLILYYKTHPASGSLLLVIRDYLLQNAIGYYGLQDATIVSGDFFAADQPADVYKQTVQTKNITGLVLCGGQSVRMGSDKAFLEYHGKPQCYHVYEMLQEICTDVFISCNASQQQKISKQYQCIVDNATFADAGPMTGLLSAFNEYPNSSFLLAGCDYPYFTKHDMMALLSAREPHFDAVCFYNNQSGFAEPLLTLYEKECALPLIKAYRQKQTSLRHFLDAIPVKYLVPSDPRSLRSIDTPDDFRHTTAGKE